MRFENTENSYRIIPLLRNLTKAKKKTLFQSKVLITSWNDSIEISIEGFELVRKEKFQFEDRYCQFFDAGNKTKDVSNLFSCRSVRSRIETFLEGIRSPVTKKDSLKNRGYSLVFPITRYGRLTTKR